MATIDGIDGGIFVRDHLSDDEATPTNIPKDIVKDVALCPTGCPLPVVTYTTLRPVPEPGNATTGVVVQWRSCCSSNCLSLDKNNQRRLSNDCDHPSP